MYGERWRLSTSICQAAVLLEWISSHRFEFRASDLAREMEVCWRTATRWLASAELAGWVRIERVHHSKTIYHPLIFVGRRRN